MISSRIFQVYASLIPIVLGAVIATTTELTFNLIGLVSAILATIAFSLQSIFSKKVLHDTNIHHMRLLHLLARIALIIFIPLWIIFDLRRMQHDEHLVSEAVFFRITIPFGRLLNVFVISSSGKEHGHIHVALPVVHGWFSELCSKYSRLYDDITRDAFNLFRMQFNKEDCHHHGIHSLAEKSRQQFQCVRHVRRHFGSLPVQQGLSFLFPDFPSDLTTYG